MADDDQGWLVCCEGHQQAATVQFNSRQVELMLGLVAKTRELGPEVVEITREVFDHQELHANFRE